jgi:hypothetical protein
MDWAAPEQAAELLAACYRIFQITRLQIIYAQPARARAENWIRDLGVDIGQFRLLAVAGHPGPAILAHLRDGAPLPDPPAAGHSRPRPIQSWFRLRRAYAEMIQGGDPPDLLELEAQARAAGADVAAIYRAALAKCSGPEMEAETGPEQQEMNL